MALFVMVINYNPPENSSVDGNLKPVFSSHISKIMNNITSKILEVNCFFLCHPGADPMEISEIGGRCLLL